MNQNTARQSQRPIKTLPTDGASIGQTPKTSINSDMSFVASRPVWRSRTTAPGMTMLAAAAIPCSTRNPISM